MTVAITLQSYLTRHAAAPPHAAMCDGAGAAIAAAVMALAEASVEIATLLRLGDLAPMVEVLGGSVNAAGDRQEALDLTAHAICHAALLKAPIAALASEEMDAPELLDGAAPIVVAIDPLDGSSNLAVDMSVGTIFSIRPAGSDPLAAFCAPGTEQLAAGFFVYGPQTVLALSMGEGTDIFTLDPRDGQYWLTAERVMVPPKTREYAINAANARHWPAPIRTYIADCVAGRDGPRGEEFNTRWIASLVAETYRILRRGGVFLYPGDRRPGYQNGRLRLLYEAQPMAFILRAAGGIATDGVNAILELSAETPHQRVPLIMGSSHEVIGIQRLHEAPSKGEVSPPLFQSRGLFRSETWAAVP